MTDQDTQRTPDHQPPTDSDELARRLIVESEDGTIAALFEPWS